MVVADPGDGGPSVTVAQAAGDGTGGTVLTQDTVFHTLSNQRRRLVLEALAEHEQVTVRELTSYVAARECGIDEADLDYKQRKRVYTSLVQTHLPMMQKHDIVAYDKSRGTVEPAADLAAFDVYLEVVPRSELDWGEFYLGLGALGVLVATLVAFDVTPFGFLSPVAYLFLFASTALVVGAVHTYRRRRARIDGGTPPGVD